MIEVESLQLSEKAARHVAEQLPACRAALLKGKPERIQQREVSVWFQGGRIFLLVQETAGERNYGYRCGWSEMAGTKFAVSGAAQVAATAATDEDADRIAKTGWASPLKAATKVEVKA